MNRRELMQAGAAAALMTMPGVAWSTPGLSFEEYRSFDALGLAEAIRSGALSATDVLEVAVAAATRLDQTLNFMATPLYERARAQLAAGLGDGAFAGVPFLLKDLGMYLEGTVTTNGSRFWNDYVATQTDTVVQRYLDAGLVVIGKSTSPEQGGTATTESVLHGATRNPWDLTRSSGGSSGGSSAAVAAGVLPMANATDGGGSIRIPASCCGLFGMKPSRGRIPSGPEALFSMMSVAHALSRSVRDSAALMDVVAGPEAGQTTIAPPPSGTFRAASQRDPQPLRIGLVLTPVSHTPVDPECILAANRAAALCEQLGHRVEPVELPLDPAEFFDAGSKLFAAGSVMRIHLREQALGREATRDDLEPVIYERYQNGKALSALALQGAIDAAGRIARQIALLQTRFDVLLSPTMAALPAELGAIDLNQVEDEAYQMRVVAMSGFTMLCNVTGQPAMSVPLHWSAAGLPVGVQFAGRYGEEALLYALAGQLERAAPWFDRLPPG